MTKLLAIRSSSAAQRSAGPSVASMRLAVGEGACLDQFIAYRAQIGFRELGGGEPEAGLEMVPQQPHLLRQRLDPLAFPQPHRLVGVEQRAQRQRTRRSRMWGRWLVAVRRCRDARSARAPLRGPRPVPLPGNGRAACGDRSRRHDSGIARCAAWLRRAGSGPATPWSYHSPGAKVGMERAVSFFVGMSRGPDFGCRLGAARLLYSGTPCDTKE